MIEKNSILKQWLELADGDYASAMHLLTLYPFREEVICYLCEQSTEKYLKAFLFLNDIEPPRTHDLMKLNRMCCEIDKEFSSVLRECSNLTPYGVQVRYPNNVEIIEEDMRGAIKDIQKIREFILTKLSI